MRAVVDLLDAAIAGVADEEITQCIHGQAFGLVEFGAGGWFSVTGETRGSVSASLW